MFYFVELKTISIFVPVRNQNGNAMNTKKYTIGQKKALYVSLREQQSPMTPAERQLFHDLTIEFRNVKDETIAEIVTLEGTEFFRSGKFVKPVYLDTFGEDYRKNWIKIQESGKGEFIFWTYVGRRIYLDF